MDTIYLNVNSNDETEVKNKFKVETDKLYTFKLLNDTESDFIIRNIDTSCGCTEVTFYNEKSKKNTTVRNLTIEPNTHIEINVKIEPKKTGNKYIWIKSSDPDINTVSATLSIIN